jgi:hypothetical protein
MAKMNNFLRTTGRALLRAQRKAARLNEGLDEILGENRTKPSDGFSKERTRRRSGLGSDRKNKMSEKLSTGSRKSFDLGFGENQEEDDERGKFF